MENRKLGDTGTVVSPLGLGTMYFGEETTDAFPILDAFVEAGGTLIDTADVYVGGDAERIVGRWIADRPRDITDRIVLATKGRFTAGPTANDAGLSRRHLHRALDASLVRLGVETIDLYQLHAWDPETPIEETLSFLNDAVRSGKIHYFGLSNFTGWQVQLVVSTARSMNFHLPVSLQQQYSLLSRENEFEVVPAALHNRIGILPWSPLAGGFLSGKYQRGGEAGPDTRAGSSNPIYSWAAGEYAASDQNWATIGAVHRVAEELSATPSQVALRWLMDKPGVTAPIFGARTLEQLRDNLGAADLVLPREAFAELEAVSAPRTSGYPYGRFGLAQRERSLQTSAPALAAVVDGGSSHPLGTT